jgi:hypothetical protein
MKKCCFLLLMSLIATVANAQTPGSTPVPTPVDKIIFSIDSVRKSAPSPVGNQNMLVSYYTFKNILKKDFSTLTGLDNTATVGKYAALNINQTNSTFTFTPITIINTDLVNNRFRWVHSFDFSGTVDKASILDLKNWRTVTLSYSATFIFNAKYHFISKQGGKSLRPDDQDYTQLYDDIVKRYKSQYAETKQSQIEKLNHPEFDNSDDAKKGYLDSVSKYEQLKTKANWTRKRYGWVKATISPLSFDNTNYIITGDLNTYKTPISKAYYIPSVLVSGNYYWAFRQGFNFYVSMFVQGMIKDTFTDIFSTSEWNKTNALLDSVSIKTDTKNVYIAPSGSIKTKLLPNMGFEGIVLFPSSSYIGAGLDLSIGYNGIISNDPLHNTGWLQNIQGGLIISFKDKNGTSNINIEPYYQSKRYIRYILASSHLWGVKLSIPFSRLY